MQKFLPVPLFFYTVDLKKDCFKELLSSKTIFKIVFKIYSIPVTLDPDPIALFLVSSHNGDVITRWWEIVLFNELALAMSA